MMMRLNVESMCAMFPSLYVICTWYPCGLGQNCGHPPLSYCPDRRYLAAFSTALLKTVSRVALYRRARKFICIVVASLSTVESSVCRRSCSTRWRCSSESGRTMSMFLGHPPVTRWYRMSCSPMRRASSVLKNAVSVSFSTCLYLRGNCAFAVFDVVVADSMTNISSSLIVFIETRFCLGMLRMMYGFDCRPGLQPAAFTVQI